MSVTVENEIYRLNLNICSLSYSVHLLIQSPNILTIILWIISGMTTLSTISDIMAIKVTKSDVSSQFNFIDCF